MAARCYGRRWNVFATRPRPAPSIACMSIRRTASHNYPYQVLLVEELQRQGIDIVFLNHAIGQTPEENLLLQVQGMMAEYERAKILERRSAR